eukprot:7654194-Ditylum_brightwellii.AAC.1
MKNHMKQQVNIISITTRKFFIEGWFKQGMKIVEQSAQKNQTQEKIDSEQVFPHIHILAPNSPIECSNTQWTPASTQSSNIEFSEE